MVRIIAIGDPHGNLEKIKKIPLKNVDLIILTGDLGSCNLNRKMAFENHEREAKGLPLREYPDSMRKRGYMEVYNSSLKVAKYLSKFAPVFTITGNVMWDNDDVKDLSYDLGEKLPFVKNDLKKLKNVRVIDNRIARFKGVKIGGLSYFFDTCWVREFKPPNYKQNMKVAKRDTDKVRKILKWFGKVDVLVHHQPPYKVLDKVSGLAPKIWWGKNAGSKVILDYIKKKQPKYSFCGHIHESKGKKKINKTEVYNLGVCGYKVINL